ncbi:MAG TPA: SRPBCC domain-containing protein [Solirubrobacterales bacterium]|jgi:uncharacterized protein YndB with AHSA1/START domain|nr:SRPBCC domain-containing protein [Solirubrobacterales bacterium]
MTDDDVTPGLDGRELTVTRVFDAPRELVWRAFTEPEQFAQWFGSPPFRTPPETVSMDVRPGGEWEATQVNSETGKQLPFAGRFREVEEPERLVFTFEDVEDRDDPHVEVVTVTLTETDGGTEVVLHQAGHMPPEQYERTERGWSGFVDQLEKLVTSQA